MSLPEADFLRQLRAAFHVEAAEHLQAMSTDLLVLEKMPAAEETRLILERVFRDAHSLKGAARAVNFGAVETVCQALESVFALWKRRAAAGTAEDFDRVHQALDLIGSLVARDEPVEVSGDRARVTIAVQQLNLITNGPPPGPVAGPGPADTDSEKSSPAAEGERPGAPAVPQPAPPVPVPLAAPNGVAPVPPRLLAPDEPDSAPVPGRERTPGADTVRISTAKLDSLLRQAEELVALKLIGSQRVAELRQLLGALEPWDKEWSRIAPDLRSTRQAAEKPGAPRLTVGGNETARVLEFLDWNHAWFRAFEQRLGALVKAVEQDRRATAGMVDHLLAEAKKMLMLPFSTLFLVLPKLVRDLCRDQGKQADLVLRGSEVEIDKRVLEEMKDPLIHLVRNCIDHGFEKPDQRAAQNKPPRAQLRVTVAQVDSNKVEIVIADDGRGIDAASVKRAAVRQGLLSEDAARQLDDAASLDLIFRSGVSTSPLLTELSGRGLGLAIVREKVERLGGQVFVETQAGAGTTFRVLLPLTLATFRGILVRAAEQTFVIPSAQLERVIRVRPGEMRTVDNQQTVALDGRAVALVPLADVLELPPPRGCRIGPISRRPLSWALVTSGWLSPWPKCCKSRRCLSKVSARRYLACATWPARRSWGPAGPWPS